jgi:hypothetical protein
MAFTAQLNGQTLYRSPDLDDHHGVGQAWILPNVQKTNAYNPQGQVFYGSPETGFTEAHTSDGDPIYDMGNMLDAQGRPIYGTKGRSDESNGAQIGGSMMTNQNYVAALQRAGITPKYDPESGWVISGTDFNRANDIYMQSIGGGIYGDKGGFINQALDAGVPLYLMMAAVTGGALGGESLGMAIGESLGLTGTAAATTGSAIVSGVQNLAMTGDLNSAIISAVSSGAGNLTGAEAAKLLPEGTDPKLIKSLSGATSGAVGAAVKKGDVGQSALIGGVAPVISDQLTSTPAPGTPTTDPYPRGDISTTGMIDPESTQPSLNEPGYTPPPDQGGVPTPPPASVNPDLPPAQNMEEVVVEDTKLPQEDKAIMDLTGIMPSKTKMPVPTSPVTSKDLADPTVENAPPPDKKSDYTGEISALLNALFSSKSGGGVGSSGSYDLGGGGGSTGPGSAALAGALRTDAGAPIFGGEKKGKKRNVWNIESLRTKDETGA